MKKLRANKRVVARIVMKRTERALASKRLAHDKRFTATCQRGQRRCQRKAWQRGNEKIRQRWEIDDVATTAVRLEAPAFFGLTRSGPRSELLRFVATLKRLTLVAKKHVEIDFRKTQRTFPDGTLLFAAVLDVILAATAPRASVRCNRATNKVVDQVLQHLGLYAKMRRKANTPITADNVKYWRVKSDTLVVGSHTESLINEYQDHFPATESAKLYEGLTEAMTNAKQHAYSTRRGQSTVEPRWWMFSQLKDGKLSVSFCDLGVGFRESLLSGENWAKAAVLRVVDAIGIKRTDSYFIKAAFELGKTRTKEPHRGKGLDELKKVIESVGGRLQILSHKGSYSYAAPGGKEDLVDFDDSVPGTVIYWQVALKGTKS